MKDQRENIVVQKSYEFSLLCIEIYKKLQSEKKEFFLSKQFLRSATSIGANINEAQSAESKADFIHKLQISLKEARETLYWVRLLSESHFFENNYGQKAYEFCDELIKLLTSIIKTLKNVKS